MYADIANAISRADNVTGNLSSTRPTVSTLKMSLSYREDVDGLRGLAVLSVVLFHLSSHWLPGGYVGVDIFFVISGFLITSLILMDVDNGNFTYLGFYRRRAVRLLPALLFTLFVCLLFGLITYPPDMLDRFGKQLFYSALGLGNILSAQGVNYFANDVASRPLLHLWSLGVEEQFYFVWPTILVLIARFKPTLTLAVFVLLVTGSLALSVFAIDNDPLGSYFLPHYRAFELGIGAIIAWALPTLRSSTRSVSPTAMHSVSILAVLLMIAPMVYLDESSPFPGFNALVPCLGAALFLLSSASAIGNRLMAVKPLVLLGLVSYPLYLLHLPALSAVSHLGYGNSLWLNIIAIVAIALPVSWFIFQYLEKPTRRLAKSYGSSPDNAGKVNRRVLIMTISLLILAAVGILLAKTGGMPERYPILNPYANELLDSSRRPFFDDYSAGVQLNETQPRSALLFGDSLMQDYVPALVRALDLTPDNVDLVTKGGCALLKDIEFLHYSDATNCELIT